MRLLNEYFTNDDVQEYYTDIIDKYTAFFSTVSDLKDATAEDERYKYISISASELMDSLQQLYSEDVDYLKSMIDELYEDEE